MIEVATAINTFGNASPKDNFASPSVTIPTVLLRDLLESIDSLKAEVSQLREELCQLREETALERARDRQRIAKLERIEPQPMQKDRAEILRALLAANNGKLLAKEARHKMHMSKQAFTNLLAVIDGIESRPYRTDKRQRLLVLK